MDSVSILPLLSDFTVTDHASPLYGRSYRRLWGSAGDWHAYLGRDGVRFDVVASSTAGVIEIQLQAKAPEADWQLLSSYSYELAALTQTAHFSVCLGQRCADNPLVPQSVRDGHPLSGTWLLRARARDTMGHWSAWTEELSLLVELPIVVKSETLQSLPPAGAAANWFEASQPKTFNIKLWIP